MANLGDLTVTIKTEFMEDGFKFKGGGGRKKKKEKREKSDSQSGNSKKELLQQNPYLSFVGGIFKSFGKGFNSLAGVAKGIKDISEVLSSILSHLVLSTEFSRKIAENTQKINDVSRRTGLTKGQVLATQEGFAKEGLEVNEVDTLLKNFVQRGQQKGFLKEGVNVTNQALSALEKIKDVKNIHEKNRLAQWFFGMNANMGSTIDLASERVDEISEHIRNSKMNMQQDRNTIVLDAAQKEVVTETVKALGFFIAEATHMFNNNILGVHNYYNQKEHESKIKHMSVKRDGLNLRQSIQDSIDLKFNIENIFGSLVNAAAQNLLKVLNNLGDINLAFEKLEKAITRVINFLGGLADICRVFVQSIMELIAKLDFWKSDEEKREKARQKAEKSRNDYEYSREKLKDLGIEFDDFGNPIVGKDLTKEQKQGLEDLKKKRKSAEHHAKDYAKKSKDMDDYQP